MDKEAVGTVISVKKQWWLKINTKPLRTHTLDGATFPHVIKVKYTADSKDYFKRKWIRAGHYVPEIGSSLKVLYNTEKPKKATVILNILNNTKL